VSLTECDGKQPARGPDDGPVAVRAGAGGRLEIEVTTADKVQVITVTPFNAFRIFGMMALMLGIKLPAAVGKGIKL